MLKPREERAPLDAYYTPQPLARAIVARLAASPGTPTPILEPHAGGGAFVDAARIAWPAADVYGEDVAGDWQQPGWFRIPFALILGNPPFLQAEEEVRKGLGRVVVGGHVAFLLRLSFLAGQRRAALYIEHPLRYLIPITPRPSFTPDGKTDASEYGVFVWQRGYTGNAEILPHLRWSPRQTRLLP